MKAAALLSRQSGFPRCSSSVCRGPSDPPKEGTLPFPPLSQPRLHPYSILPLALCPPQLSSCLWVQVIPPPPASSRFWGSLLLSQAALETRWAPYAVGSVGATRSRCWELPPLERSEVWRAAICCTLATGFNFVTLCILNEVRGGCWASQVMGFAGFSEEVELFVHLRCVLSSDSIVARHRCDRRSTLFLTEVSLLTPSIPVGSLVYWLKP